MIINDQGTANLLQPLLCLRFVIAFVFLSHFTGNTKESQSIYERNEIENSSSHLLDIIIESELISRNCQPAPLCSDYVFLRRAYLDLNARAPSISEISEFTQKSSAHKRENIIQELIRRPRFEHYQVLKLCDLLRVKSEFPIKLWPNAVQAYERWLYDAIHLGLSWQEMVRQLLTSSGSNFRQPAVNFYRALSPRTPKSWAQAVALSFMGVRPESFTEKQWDNMAVFFSTIKSKSTLEWKEEIIYHDRDVLGDKSSPTQAYFPDGSSVMIPADADPRVIFAEWLTADENPWLARAFVNRIWTSLLGSPIIPGVDDLREDNPPFSQELMDILCQQFVTNKTNIKKLIHFICTSHTYQRSSRPAAGSPSFPGFSHYTVRRLEAEVLIDCVSQLTGMPQGYTSQVPEPFTYIPANLGAVRLNDGTITNPFLELFGRPPRDTGRYDERDNEPSKKQALFMLNSTKLNTALTKSKRLKKLIATKGKKDKQTLNKIYLSILSRPPLGNEIENYNSYRKKQGNKYALQDIVWALINSTEFSYKH
ncbi:MAG: DUF1553 domain-containing protein [Planctomycetes bacterium]|nr:DUF1553 domain-containing protein [Planctomycetota bacterium]